MPDRITADRAMARNRDLTGGISRAHALRATGPIGNDSVRQVAKIRTRDRFEKHLPNRTRWCHVCGAIYLISRLAACCHKPATGQGLPKQKPSWRAFQLCVAR